MRYARHRADKQHAKRIRLHRTLRQLLQRIHSPASVTLIRYHVNVVNTATYSYKPAVLVITSDQSNLT